jgi:hypothetical protein
MIARIRALPPSGATTSRAAGRSRASGSCPMRPAPSTAAAGPETSGGAGRSASGGRRHSGSPSRRWRGRRHRSLGGSSGLLLVTPHAGAYLDTSDLARGKGPDRLSRSRRLAAGWWPWR